MSQPSSHIESYVYSGVIGVLVELEASTSSALQAESFSALARHLAMHIAAMAPTSIEDLLGQPAVSNPDLLVRQIVDQTAQQLSAEVGIVRFVRWVAGSPRTGEPPRSPALIQGLPAA